MDPSLTRDTLARLIGEESRALAELEQLLESEHGLLAGNDPEAIATAGRRRQHCVGTLLRLDSERLSLCRMLGHGGDAAGMQHVLDWSDPQGTLDAAWQARGKAALRCRELNDRNGALASAQLHRVSGRLQALVGAGRPDATPSTYSDRGPQSAVSPGRLLAASV